ncbi:MAG: hypothetical protein ROO76_09790 [Terriglobia bacterium]|nr:hypothetical protein [Terriglobia bacterium]
MINHPHLANSILTEAEAKALLKPYFPTIKKCIDDAWDEWLALDKRHRFDKRARAAFLHSMITHNALAAFAKHEDAKTVPGNGTFWLYIGDHIKSRFKKLDRNRRYRNYPTNTQLKLEIQGNIPGVLPGTYLTLGYLLDPLEQKVAHHLVTLQIRKKILYAIDIDAELASATVPVVQIPAPVKTVTEAQTEKRRVRPRGERRETEVKAKSKGTFAGE